MQYKTRFLAFVIVVLVTISGCASFPQEELARVNQMPSVDQYENKPSAYIDINFYVGKPGNKKMSSTRAAKIVKESVREVLDESKLFSSYTFELNPETSVDYVIEMDVYNHGDLVLAAISGVITGATFGVVPGRAKDNYTLETRLHDKNELKKVHRSTDAIATWIGWIFIPFMGNTPKEAMGDTLKNQVKAAFQELVNEGVIEYSGTTSVQGDIVSYK